VSGSDKEAEEEKDGMPAPPPRSESEPAGPCKWIKESTKNATKNKTVIYHDTIRWKRMPKHAQPSLTFKKVEFVFPATAIQNLSSSK
jgi:hypothetical protein